jgi:hypothetical protein
MDALAGNNARQFLASLEGNCTASSLQNNFTLRKRQWLYVFGMWFRILPNER